MAKVAAKKSSTRKRGATKGSRASSSVDRTKLPLPESTFRGTIGKTYLESKSDWPQVPTPPAGAPNVVVILLDDVGFAQVSTFGGPVPTPELDKPAAKGLRYNRFDSTAICGPSRAALITGRNRHNCGVGSLAEWATGYPSYKNKFTGRIERVDIELGPLDLAPEDEVKLHEMHSAFAGAHD